MSRKHGVKIEPTELNKYHQLQYNYKPFEDQNKMSKAPKFTEEDLTSFGNYLLSDKRYETIIFNDGRPIGNVENVLRNVCHADFENWKESLK